MPVLSAYFDVYGILLRIRADESESRFIDDVREEFSFFSCLEFVQAPSIDVTLVGASSQGRPRAGLRTKLGIVSRVGGDRHVTFTDGSWVRFRQSSGGRARTAEFGIASPAALGPLENFLHSSLGESLERAGFVRLHALASQRSTQPATIEMAPRGFGKSTKAARLLNETSTKLFGDETVLVRNARVYSYPARIALRMDDGANLTGSTRTFLGSVKNLVVIDRLKVPAPESLGVLVFYSRAPFGLRRLAFIVSVCLGLGLPQMKEYMIRLSNLSSLLHALAQRLAFALRMLGSSRLKFGRGPYLAP